MPTQRFFLILLVCTLGAALVPTFYPALDLAVASYFLQPNPPMKTGDWWWVYGINEYVPALFRTIAVLCIPAWLYLRRHASWHQWARPVAFVGLALLAGPGLLVSASKDITLRARPFHVTEFSGPRSFSPALQRADQCDDNCAFPSGHTADGIFLASLMLIFPRRRWFWLGAGLLGGLVVGFCRVSVGAHWLSDVLWAFPITLFASWLVFVAMEKWGLLNTQNHQTAFERGKNNKK